MLSCPGIEKLDAFLAGHLGGEEAPQLEAHVDVCSRCQDTLERLSSIEMTIAEVVDRVARPQPAIGNWNEHRADRKAEAVREAQWEAPAADSTAADEELPQIPGHKILGWVGQGGMGTVYRGTQLDLDREVAIKVLDARLASDLQQLTKRFSHEAQVTANLDHPSIVPVHAIGRDMDGRLVIQIWGSAARALYAYRAGKSANAIEWAQKCLDAAVTDQARAFALACQALSHHQLGQPDAARESLEQATTLIAAALSEFRTDPKMRSWQDWLIAKVLCQEARQELAASKQE